MIVRIAGFGLLLIGCLLIGVRIYQVSEMAFGLGKVIAVDNYRGECRRTSGRTQDCTRMRAKIEFAIDQNSPKIEKELDLGRYSAAIVVGADLPIMYSLENPEKVQLADLHQDWMAPVGIFMVGLLITLVSVGSKKAKKPQE